MCRKTYLMGWGYGSINSAFSMHDAMGPVLHSTQNWVVGTLLHVQCFPEAGKSEIHSHPQLQSTLYTQQRKN